MPDQVQRFTVDLGDPLKPPLPCDVLVRSPDGQWVCRSDYERLEAELDEARTERDMRRTQASVAELWVDRLQRTAEPYLQIPCPGCGHKRSDHDPACEERGCGCKGFVEPVGYTPDEMAANARARQVEERADQAIKQRDKELRERLEAAAKEFEVRAARAERIKEQGGDGAGECVGEKVAFNEAADYLRRFVLDSIFEEGDDE